MIGGVLTYRHLGVLGVCGSTIGADGSGEFAYVIEGTPADAWIWAKTHLAKAGIENRLIEVRLVLAEDGYCGPLISIVQAVKQSAPEPQPVQSPHPPATGDSLSPIGAEADAKS
jgi:hypothetical protein